ncbi:MAG: CRISPR-associated protein, Cse1 family [Candidatus Carbobacillus altaicus]|uniref:CRISPR-associated protein, Cse1 family n=1 Tax=Candidatus Carbonibacillus altaicus TaxID=2163959 RepID=A0A2R6XZD8_9BACL|nr:MAG: CRISPR-associated protein, Cse1 family [Candidatus Carbobacillus altaicus]
MGSPYGSNYPNLLQDKMIRVVLKTGGMIVVTLPELFELLGKNGVSSYVGLQSHQEEAFHVFLSQLGTIALNRNGNQNPVMPTSFWYEALLNIVEPHGLDAWALVNPDKEKPAFMQPPLRGNLLKRLKPVEKYPDAADFLDVLITAKNHDLKIGRATSAHLDTWMFSLINNQTTNGFSGRDNYGISRMNGGYGNRPIVETVRSLEPGQRWQDAVRRLLNYRQELLQKDYGFQDRGKALLWLEPWDGEHALSLNELDPYYIEICRAYRLEDENGRIVALFSPSKSRRINAEQLKGVVGDPWLPIERSKKDPQALTYSSNGIGANDLRRILFEDQLSLSPLQQPDPRWKEEDSVYLLVSVLVRGQGRTDGYYSRLLPIPRPVRRILFGRREVLRNKRDILAHLSKTGIEMAGVMETKVLRFAIFSYLQAREKDLSFKRDAHNAWWSNHVAETFRTKWEDHFFDWLWRAADTAPNDEELGNEGKEKLEKLWAEWLRDFALESLRESISKLPIADGRRYKSIVVAERLFYARLYHEFPQLKKKESKDILPEEVTVSDPGN